MQCDCIGTPAWSTCCGKPKPMVDNGLSGVIADLMASLDERKRIQQIHRDECTRRPCERCEIWLCCWTDPDGSRCPAETLVPRDDRQGSVRPALCDAHRGMWERRPLIKAALETIPPVFAVEKLRFVKAKHTIEERCPEFGSIRRATRSAIVGRQSFVLYGDSGAGKTSAACYLLRWIIDQGYKPDSSPTQIADATGARFVAARSLAAWGKEQRLGFPEHEDIKRAKAASILLIDDMGAEDVREKQPIENVIAERYDRGAITLVTTGIERDIFKKRYTGGTERRVTEGDTWIAL